MAERHAAVLAELSELGMAFARDARRDAEAAETAEERARQALVFQRIARSVRQTLALEAKFAREAQQAGRERAELQRREDQRRTAERKERLEARIHGLTWRETEKMDEAEEEEFDELVGDAVYREIVSGTFLTDDLDAQVGRILAAVGYERAPGGGVRRIPPRDEAAEGTSSPEPAFDDSA